MITLKQLVNEQKINDMSDIQVIKAFFDLNNMEEEGIDLIYELTKLKVEKMKHKQKMVKDWATCLPSKYLYENYDLDIADKLHMLEIDYLANGGELSSKLLEWAKKNIPNIVRPKVYFNPLVDWLKAQDIKFKNQ